MFRKIRTAFAASALLALGLTASDTCVAQDVVAYAEGRPEIDYDAFWKYTDKAAETGFRPLARESLALARQLNDAMLRLSETEKEPGKSTAVRLEIRDLLVKYRDNKTTLVRIANECLKNPPPREDDLAIIKRLRETELQGLHWSDAKFIDCLRDISGAMNLRFVMHPDVLKFNTIDARLPKTAADGVLRQITYGFDNEYLVHQGEIVIIKSLKRNDVRLQKYLDEHPDWKYWEVEKVQDVEDDL